MLFKRKRVKIYLYHNSFQEVPAKPWQAPKTWAECLSLAKNLIRALARGLFELSFFIGKLLVQIPKAAKTGALFTRNFSQTGFKKLNQKFQFMRMRASEKKFQYSLALFLLLSLASAGWFGANQLLGSGLALKGKVLGVTDSALSHLEQAKTDLLLQNTQLAQTQFNQAYLDFSQGLNDLNTAESFIKSLTAVLPQTRNSQAILGAAVLTSQAGIDLSQFALYLQNLKFTSAGVVGTDDLARDFGVMQENLNSGSANIKEALALFEQVKSDSLPEPFKVKFSQAQNQLTALNAGLAGVNGLFGLAQKILLGQKNVLFVLENNNELRAGGGFIGTYGAATISQGKLLNLEINSIYDLDGQLKDFILPPLPLLAVNPRWYLRDSNWFADFPQSAKKISSFYEKEGGETPDLIVALTPKLITELLALTGGVKLPLYNLELTADNFVENVQVATSVNYDKTLNSPKQLLADFVPALFESLEKLKADKKDALVETIFNNLQNKQIIFYSRDPQIQNALSQFNWTGEIKPAPKDYLAVYSSNLGGSKTDLFIDQSIGLKTQITPEGEIINTLSLTRKNNLPKLPQAKNLSYLRFLAPKGSQLLSSGGFSPQNLIKLEQSFAKTDPEVYAWEKNLVTDTLSQTQIGEEAGKTFFGNWLELNGDEVKTVSLTYRLPFKFRNPDSYSLLLQKQPGAKAAAFNFQLSFPGRTELWANFTAQSSNSDSLNHELTLDGDKFLGAVISGR